MSPNFRSRRLVLGFAAFLGLLAPGPSRADTVDASSTTMLIVRDQSRAGDLFTVAPAYELLSVSARDLQNPVADNLQLVFSGWGAASIGHNLRLVRQEPAGAPPLRRPRSRLRPGRGLAAQPAASPRSPAGGWRRHRRAPARRRQRPRPAALRVRRLRLRRLAGVPALRRAGYRGDVQPAARHLRRRRPGLLDVPRWGEMGVSGWTSWIGATPAAASSGPTRASRPGVR